MKEDIVSVLGLVPSMRFILSPLLSPSSRSPQSILSDCLLSLQNAYITDYLTLGVGIEKGIIII